MSGTYMPNDGSLIAANNAACTAAPTYGDAGKLCATNPDSLNMTFTCMAGSSASSKCKQSNKILDKVGGTPFAGLNHNYEIRLKSPTGSGKDAMAGSGVLAAKSDADPNAKRSVGRQLGIGQMTPKISRKTKNN